MLQPKLTTAIDVKRPAVEQVLEDLKQGPFAMLSDRALAYLTSRVLWVARDAYEQGVKEGVKSAKQAKRRGQWSV
jgi:hypothetical protein